MSELNNEEKKNIPSIGFYRPNYSYVDTKSRDIYFDGKKEAKNNRKYFKLKKIFLFLNNKI